MSITIKKSSPYDLGWYESFFQWSSPYEKDMDKLRDLASYSVKCEKSGIGWKGEKCFSSEEVKLMVNQYAYEVVKGNIPEYVQWDYNDPRIRNAESVILYLTGKYKNATQNRWRVLMQSLSSITKGFNSKGVGGNSVRVQIRPDYLFPLTKLQNKESSELNKAYEDADEQGLKKKLENVGQEIQDFLGDVWGIGKYVIIGAGVLIVGSYVLPLINKKQ